ncbi:hypothetical protein C2W64_03647 [Brevibacillus laterosporus]|nr:hypothetical protein C2W64_03647 [Brevibacillus laterosporus]
MNVEYPPSFSQWVQLKQKKPSIQDSLSHNNSKFSTFY